MSGRAPVLRAVLAPCALAAAALAGACASSGSAPAPGGVAPAPSITGGGTTLDLTFNPSRGVVADAVEATPEAVWAVLPQAYAELGITVREVSEASRVLGNSRLVVSRRLGDVALSRYLECGSSLTGPFADRYRIEILLRTAVVAAEGGRARLESYLEASARNPEGGSNTGVACATTQRLEREIARRVRALVGGGA